ncbi:MAG: hypothetical protein AcusKO_22750 [Acuticoccus sp.]
MVHRSIAALFAVFVAASPLSPAAHAQGTGEAFPLGVPGLAQDEVGKIKSMIEEWSKDLVSGDLAGWETYWTSDAVLAPPGADRLVGKSKIAGYAKANFSGVTGFTFTDWSVAGREDLAVVTNTIQTEGGSSPMIANQMIILRSEGGNWKVQSVLYNLPN